MDVNQNSLTSPSSVQVIETSFNSVYETEALDTVDTAQQPMTDMALHNDASEKEEQAGFSGAGAAESVNGSQENPKAQTNKSERTISVAEILIRTKEEKEAKASTSSSNTVVTEHNPQAAFSVEDSPSQLASLDPSPVESNTSDIPPVESNFSEPLQSEPLSAKVSVLASETVSAPSSANVSEPASTPVSSQQPNRKKAKTSTRKTKNSEQSAQSQQPVVAESESSVDSDSNLFLAEQIEEVTVEDPYADIQQTATQQTDTLQAHTQQAEILKEQSSVVQVESKQDRTTKHSAVPTANYRQSIHDLQQSAVAEGINLEINEDLLNFPDEEICNLGVVEIKGRKNFVKEFCTFSFRDESLGKKVTDIQLNTDDPEQLSKLLPQSNTVSLDKFIESFALYTGRVADPNYAKYRRQIALIPESSQEFEAYFSRLHNVFLFGQSATIEDFFSKAFKRPAVNKILERYLPYGSVPLKSLYRMHLRFSALSRLEPNAENIMNCNVPYPEVENISATPLVTTYTSANFMREQAAAVEPSMRVEQPTTQYQRQFDNVAYESAVPNRVEGIGNSEFANQTPNFNQVGYGEPQVVSCSTYDSYQAQAPMNQQHHNAWQPTRNPWQQNNEYAPRLNGAPSNANYSASPEVYAAPRNMEGRVGEYANQGQQVGQNQYANNGQYVNHSSQGHYVNQAYAQNQGQSQSPNFVSPTNPSLNQQGANAFSRPYAAAGNSNTGYASPHHTGFSQAASLSMAAGTSMGSPMNPAPNMGGVPPRMNADHGAAQGMPPYQPYSSNQSMQQMPWSTQSQPLINQPAEQLSPRAANGGGNKDNMTQPNVAPYAPVYANNQMMQPAYNGSEQGAMIANMSPSQMPYCTNQLKQQEFGARYQGGSLPESYAQSSSTQANRQNTAQWGNQGSKGNRRPREPQTRYRLLQNSAVLKL